MKHLHLIYPALLCLGALFPASAASEDAYPLIARERSVDGAAAALQQLIERHPLVLRVRLLPAERNCAPCAQVQASVSKCYKSPQGALPVGTRVTYEPISTQYNQLMDEAYILASGIEHCQDGTFKLHRCTIVPTFADGRPSQTIMAIALTWSRLSTLDEEKALTQPNTPSPAAQP